MGEETRRIPVVIAGLWPATDDDPESGAKVIICDQLDDATLLLGHSDTSGQFRATLPKECAEKSVRVSVVQPGFQFDSVENLKIELWGLFVPLGLRKDFSDHQADITTRQRWKNWSSSKEYSKALEITKTATRRAEIMSDVTSQFYTCFVSYSSKDQEFASRLHADLQNAGVSCWYAPHDLPIGAKTWDGIDEAIRTRDKLLLILSENAIRSDWVEDEVTKAFAEEHRRRDLVLFPVRLDEAVMDTREPWAGKLRDGRNIGNFTRWQEHDAYKATFERVLLDLRDER